MLGHSSVPLRDMILPNTIFPEAAELLTAHILYAAAE